MNSEELLNNKLKEQFPELIFEITKFRDELTILLPQKNIVEVCKYLKTESELEYLLCEDITAIDWSRRKDRFTVVYHIYSFKNNLRLRLKTNVDGSDYAIDSVTSVWEAANWHERETFDMYGIKFNGHPDLRRMYMPEDFEYFPLRKDFPIMGIPGSIPLPKK
ncbi:MAG: NADH-quinone oxidoreductase subunit C [Ignavibacteriaceae bacterium]|jgi:NADH-quinone oxidoreductase subunit C